MREQNIKCFGEGNDQQVPIELLNSAILLNARLTIVWKYNLNLAILSTETLKQIITNYENINIEKNYCKVMQVSDPMLTTQWIVI